ncbi:vacuolar protein sorting-associated protein 28 homolog 2, partial [Tanacetum coccineum]
MLGPSWKIMVLWNVMINIVVVSRSCSNGTPEKRHQKVWRQIKYGCSSGLMMYIPWEEGGDDTGRLTWLNIEGLPALGRNVGAIKSVLNDVFFTFSFLRIAALSYWCSTIPSLIGVLFDFEGKTKMKEWIGRLSKMGVADELTEQQARQ